MIYLKTVIISILVSAFFASGIFMSYYDIKYINSLYIFVPILMCVAIYCLLKYSIKQRINIEMVSVKMYYPLSLMLLFITMGFSAINLNFDDLLNVNFADIRSDFMEKDVSLTAQLVPLLIVYPFVHMLILVTDKQKGINIKTLVLVFGILFVSLASGGRQTLFQIFILILAIKGGKIFAKLSNLLFLGAFIAMAAIITIGRFNNPDVSKAYLLENTMPSHVSDFLKEGEENRNLKEVTMETSFYFGHQIPAFCNKIENLEISVFPSYPLGMQPFIERQLSKIGIVPYLQMDRYERFLGLAEGSGFFAVSWSTGFLDIYFNLGWIGAFLFFFTVSFALFTCQQNLDYKKTSRYRILQAFNILFIITMFMTPAFFDTTIFFSYIFLFFNRIR